jgi:putative acetyltransferase
MYKQADWRYGMNVETNRTTSACLELPTGNDVEIIEFQPELRSHFRTLNEEWISKYFKLEPKDKRTLNNPEEEILQPGGVILFARLPETGDIVGTCALVNLGAGRYELAKMAVTEKVRGRKIGKKLLQAAIEKTRSLNASTVVLLTNSQLTPAINLYKSLGFIQLPFEEESPYARADVFMRLDL